MEYVATQRCPSCKGVNTVVSLTTPPRSHQYHDPGVDVRWACVDCKCAFEPSNKHEMLPVLMCSKCGAPTKHKFLRSDRGTFKSLASEFQQSSIPVVHELYACPCGEVRIYGSLSLPAPFLSVVGAKEEAQVAAT